MSGFRSQRAYEDIQVAISLAKVPASSAPTWTTYNFGIPGGIEFAVLGFSVNNYLDFYVQTSHTMALNSILDNHIHWTIPANSETEENIKFQLHVVAAGVGEKFAVPTGSPYASEHKLYGDEAAQHNLLEIAEIPGVNTTVSSVYVCRLMRIAASTREYSNPVYVLFNDCHYQKDDTGSITEYLK